MGGCLSQVFQNGSALLSHSHGHRISEATASKVQIIINALVANPKVSLQRLEALLVQIPKVRLFTYKILYLLSAVLLSNNIFGKYSIFSYLGEFIACSLQHFVSTFYIWDTFNKGMFTFCDYVIEISLVLKHSKGILCKAF